MALAIGVTSLSSSQCWAGGGVTLITLILDTLALDTLTLILVVLVVSSSSSCHHGIGSSLSCQC